MSRFTARSHSGSLIGKIIGSSDGAGMDELNSWLESTLKRELGLDRIERDDDSDIPNCCW